MSYLLADQRTRCSQIGDNVIYEVLLIQGRQTRGGGQQGLLPHQ